MNAEFKQGYDAGLRGELPQDPKGFYWWEGWELAHAEIGVVGRMASHPTPIGGNWFDSSATH